MDAFNWLFDPSDDYARLRNSNPPVSCPLCGQIAHEYRRSLTTEMMQVLIAMWREKKQEWVRVPDLRYANGRPVAKGGDYAKMRFWGLIENKPEDRRDDGSSRTGWWRITETGRIFVLGQSTVVKHAFVFDNQTRIMAGAPVGIAAALGTKFNYAELMAGV